MRRIKITIYLFALFLISLCLGLSSCIEPIEFKSSEEVGVLVVDGTFSTGGDSSIVKLLRTDILGKRVFPPETGAQVIIHDDQNKSEQYEEIRPGEYYLPGAQIWAQTGRSYFLEIILSNGTSYQSRPEKILQAPAIDELTFSITIENQIVDEVREVERKFFNLFVNGQITGPPEETFIRWDVEYSYAVSEIVCHPLQILKTCYISPPFNVDALLLLDGSQLKSGANFREQIVKQTVDYAFGQAAAFYVSQKAISQSAFQYWENIDKIVNDVGSIFDAQPAPVPGNIFNPEDPEELVLGYFSAFDEKKRLAFIRRPDLGDLAEQPFCGLPGLAPDPLPDACCNCLRLDFSSTIPPPFWP